MKKVLSVAAVALALSATAAQAHEGLYVGGNFQMGNFDLEVPSAAPAFDKNTIGGKHAAATLNIVAGYDFNQYFAVEGRVGIPSSSETSTTGQLLGSRTVEGKPQTSYAVFGKGTLPLTEMFSLYALVGVGSSPYQVEVTDKPILGSESKESLKFDGVSLQYAAGVEVNFTQNIAMTAEYGMFGYGKKKIENQEFKYDTTGFNIGVKYKF
ncbi:porin family protein [Vibrio europaeus]|uniref:Porin family protein n=1 Tax=Vibrio europaeus TaxID=300876 RepID=A0AAE7DYX7_9VIBR|nr:outer membrane beta-barrel protein [Vibrio europaeus]MDC5805979.1 porin family protein [Vibrio europaeus]MDC5812277.1 porin family protein [Vibrio europaeus]MDC5825949.1 porin family protein [Vibrio europaeus]MDC5831312.1 porin family protein [Vibrio europaeus]MDC5834268.1 porin family protein [Vibrio europaeus]